MSGGEGKSSAPTIDINAAISLLTVLGTAATHAIEAYQQGRALAAAAGVSDADLAAADSRFARVYSDPLATSDRDA